MSAMTMEQTVCAVEPRKVNTRNGEQFVYDIIDSTNTKWTAWERELAERAYATKDQVAVWKVDVTENGKYTNRTLKDIQVKPTAGFGPALSALEAQIGDGRAQEPTKTAAAFPGARSEADYRDRTIFRQTAAKVVGVLAQGQGMTPDEFWGNIQDLVRYFETGETPSEVETVAAVAASFGAPPEDDIPF